MFVIFSNLYKRSIIILLLVASLITILILIKSKTTLIPKIILLLLLLSFYLSILTIFEITSPLTLKIYLWLAISFIISYFYLIGGLIFFILSIIKLIFQNNFLKGSVKIPFSPLIKRNYSFIIISTIFLMTIYFYQKLIITENLPLSFETFQKITNGGDKLFSFLSIDFSFKKNLLEITPVVDLLKDLPLIYKQNLSKQFNYPFEKIIYQSIKDTWNNFKIKNLYILTLLSIFVFLTFTVAKILQVFIIIFSYIFYQFFLKINLIKISLKPTNKEFLEI